MEDLNFRVLHVPTENFSSSDEWEDFKKQYAKKLKRHLQSSFMMDDVTVNVFKIRKSEDEGFPEIDELIFEVRAKPSSNSIRSKHLYYRELLREWNRLFPPPLSPTVILHEDNNFLPRRRTCHKTSCSDVAFGVLPHNGEFRQYASLKCYLYTDLLADFFHDTRNMKITFSNKELRLSYNDIRNIFVNLSCPGEIFLDICNPPLFFDLINSRYGGYVINKLTLVMPFEVGRSNVIRLSLLNDTILEEIISMLHFKNAGKPIHYAYIVSRQSPMPREEPFSLPTFSCTYLLTAIFKRNFTMAAQTSFSVSQSISELSELCSENSECLEKALTLVLAAVDSGKIVNYWHAIKSQYRYYKSNKDEINFKHYVFPEKCRMIRRVTLTPTRQLLWPPEIMFGNRVLRNYDSNYALRVSFRDDTNSKLSFHTKYYENIFDLTIFLPMTWGIDIGTRHYEFLGWSNSQIRDHGVWMYAEDEDGNTVRDIRSWMGDFSRIHSVPKYMARMGQCFSQTEDAVSVPLDEMYVKTEKDIEGGFDEANFKPYCFSDGIGKISVKLAKEVHEALGHDKLCSAFQIRYGGYKGMLVVDPTLKDIDIVFRDSMKKFNSPQNTKLEIARTSSPIKLQLNRPLITILSDLGVRHRTFLKLQEEMLKTLTDMLFDEKKAAAFLHSKTPNQLLEYNDLSSSGIYLTTEPFFRALLLALHRHHVERIKTRANLAIDPNHGRNMLGVLDETGSLKYGEVFVQYTKDLSYGETRKDTVILERTVLVTKNPCMLPGDVRKFKAVNIPKLQHIVDCIVFPQNGWRPHPSEMAGSDLDGDEYAVLWNDDLIFHRENEKPGRFPHLSEEYNEDITEPDMINFLITYIKNDKLGNIATAHLVQADATDIFSESCIKLAKKFNFAVDYAKTGKMQHMDPTEKPKDYPDFMENKYKKTYKSKKALGKMFRVVRDYESENNQASIAYKNIQVDEDLKYPGWEKYKENAIKSRNKYNTLLKTILRTYGIEHEAEMFSGAFTKLHCRFQERKEREEIEKVVLQCIKRLTKCLSDEFLEEFKNIIKSKDIDVHILQKASAWYVVTYSDTNAKFLSFPWTVSKYLAAIKVQKVSINPLYISPIVEQMDQQIKACESLLPPASEWDTKLKFNYDFICDQDAVVLALRVLILWAQDEEIIVKPGKNTRHLLFTEVFIKLFLYIAESAKYLVKKDKSAPVSDKNKFSAASLCLEFFRFCLTLRFYNKYEVEGIIPFTVYKYSTLSKKAVVSYHMFAVTGKFRNIYFDLKGAENIIDMNPIQIDSDIFSSGPIDELQLKRAEEELITYSEAESIMLREIRLTKKVIVSARGSEQSLTALKSILRKNPDSLKKLVISNHV